MHNIQLNFNDNIFIINYQGTHPQALGPKTRQ